MGIDKSSLSYHGKSQKDFLVDLLSEKFTSQNGVYLSTRQEQDVDGNTIDDTLRILVLLEVFVRHFKKTQIQLGLS